MNNKSIALILLILTTFFISYSMPLQSQEIDDLITNRIDEDLLRENINKRTEEIPNIKKKDVLIDTLNIQIDNLFDLVSLLDNQIDSLNAIIEKTPKIDYSIWPLPLLLEDTSVFQIKGLRELKAPAMLKNQYDIVCLVADIRLLLDDIDIKIEECISFAQKNGLNQIDQNELILKFISTDVDTVYGLFTELKNLDTHTLSQDQNEYIEQLKNRYRNYRKYYKK